MVEIRQIGEDEVDKLLDVLGRAMPREDTGGAAGFVDWKRQAEAMVWLLAERDGVVVGAGYALTGWHTPPHRAIGAALVAPVHRGTGSATSSARRSSAGRASTARPSSKGRWLRTTRGAWRGQPPAATRKPDAIRRWCST